MADISTRIPVKAAYDAVALFPSTVDAVAHTVNGSAFSLPRPLGGMQFELDVTAAATLAGDTLDVKVQTLLDGPNGATWTDAVHFTQILGNGGVKRIFAKITMNTAEAMYEDHANGLAAGSIKNLFGDQWRVSYVTVGTGSFTFSVSACPV